MTVRIARWSATHPWRAIGLWLVFVVACVALGTAAGTKNATPQDMGTGQSGRATAMLHKAGMDDPAAENILITGKPAQRTVDDVTATMRGLAAVGTPQRSGDAVLVPLTMKGDPVTAKDRVGPLLAATGALQKRHPEVTIEETGTASINHGLDEQIGADLGKAEGLSLPITLLIMMVAFGAIVAAGVPVLLAISAVAGATGLSALASQVVPAVDTIDSMIMLMGMAVGVDYSLFYLKREREERARGRSRLDAIEIAARTSGHSVVVSAVAVIVSMAGLYLTGHVIFTSLATGAIIVVAVAMLGSLTVLPALLVKLGRAVDRPRIPVLWRLSASRSGGGRVWGALLRPALRRPGVTLLVSVLAMLALALPALGMNLKSTGTDELPRSIAAMRTYDRMTAAFPGERAPHRVVVQATAERSGEVSTALRSLGGRAQGVEQPVIRTSADKTVTELSVTSPADTNSVRAKQAVRELRELAAETLHGVRWAVGGETADNMDFAARLGDRLPLVVGFVLLLTFVMMAVTFRSLTVALTTIAINLLSALASFGVLVLVFQYSWAERLLDFHSTGTVVAWLPLFIFAVLFGLSMDYHVFVVGRIREAAQRGLPIRAAVADGITRSAGVVTSAAIVMVSVFAVFATLSMAEMKQMGVGLAAAVLLDALIVRIVILPAALVLLGRWIRWPARQPAPATAPSTYGQAVESGSISAK
jgi:RND superfamily putative drug exporter